MTAFTASRWFRFGFSLRTLFVIVTAIGCWLGYSLNWIKQRNDALEVPTSDGGPLVYFPIFEDEVREPPIALRPFFVRGFAKILYSPGLNAQEIARVKRLFPEAEALPCR